MDKICDNNKIKTFHKGNRIICKIGNTQVVFVFKADTEFVLTDNIIIECDIYSSYKEWDIEVNIDNTLYSINTISKSNKIKLNDLTNMSEGTHSIIITVYEKGNVIGRAIYPSVIISNNTDVVVSERNRLPYISTYYIEPILDINESWDIELYVDDYYGSYYNELDKKQKFNLYITIEGKEDIVYNSINGGDHIITMPPFEQYGCYDFSLQCEDEQGRKSHVLWNEVWVKPDMEIKEYQMTEEDLITYNLINKKIENIVPIYVSENEYTDLSDYSINRDTILSSKDEVINYNIPSGEYALFMADFDNDGQYDRFKATNQQSYIYTSQYIKYADDYDENNISTMATNNQQGLQQLINDKIAEGYNKVTLIKDGYFIVAPRIKQDNEGNGGEGSIYIEADNFTLDLNGSTIKLNKFAGESCLIVNLAFSFNSHIINGTIEGDAFTHDYENSTDNSEWVNGMGLIGDCKYSSYENVTLQRSAGYGYVYGGSFTNRDATKKTALSICNIGTFANGDLDKQGNLIEATDRSVSGFVDVSGLIEEYKTVYNKSQGMFQISRYLGYQGNGMYNWCYKLFVYDENKNFLEEYVGHQYRNVKVHKDTKYIRVVALAPADQIDTNLKAIFFRLPQNCYSKKITIKEIRGTGGAGYGQLNCLFEDIDIHACGLHVTPVAFDFEDGWDQMQDITFRNVNSYSDGSGSELIMFCGGHNIIIENMTHGAPYFYGRTRNYVSRNNTITSRATFGYDSFIKTGFPKVVNCNFTNITNDINCTMKNCKSIVSGNKTSYNCTIEGLGNGFTQSSNVCSTDSSVYLNDSFIAYKCRFDTKTDYNRLSFNHGEGITPKFYDCTFTKKTVFDDHNKYGSSYAENCEFKNGLTIKPNVTLMTEEHIIEFKNCIIDVTNNEPLIRTSRYVYSEGAVYVKFVDCKINTDINNSLIYDYSVSKNGNIIFENCIFNSNNSCLLFDAYVNERTYENLNIKLINTALPSNIDVSNIENIDGVNLIIEN